MWYPEGELAVDGLALDLVPGVVFVFQAAVIRVSCFVFVIGAGFGDWCFLCLGFVVFV